MNNILGGLNYDAELASEDYKAYRDTVEKEIIARFLLSMGSPPYTKPSFGIVDIEDPGLISTGDTSRSLAVTVSSVNGLQISVVKGYAVTESGAVVNVPENVFSLELARTQANDVNVVFLENELIQGGHSNVNAYMDVLSSQEIQSTSMLRVDLLANYMNPSLYPEERKKNIVVIAVATVLQTSTGSLELSIDMTRNTYSFLRPWFSVVDIQHRSSVGSGTVSSSNPHGMTINDLDTTGNVNLFQGLSDSGHILSRDMKLPKVKGAKVCYESIPVSRIKTDVTGNVTAGSKYGGMGAKYVELLSYPTSVCSCYALDTKSNAFAVDLIQKTNILVFGPHELLEKDLVLEYTETSALLPPVNVSSNLLTFGQPNIYETMVVGGKTLTSIPDPTISFEGYGPFPRKYKIYLLPSKTLVAYPQTIFPATRLDVMGTSLITLNTTMQQPARLRVALTRLDTVSTTSVRMVIYGTDTNDNNISEYVTISAQNMYIDETIHQ